jgi:hypothetical protein
MGKPVVSVSTPEIDKYAGVVRIARSRHEFLTQLDAAIAAGPQPAEVALRVSRVTPESWDARLRAVMEIVREHMTPGTEPAPAAHTPAQLAAD